VLTGAADLGGGVWFATTGRGGGVSTGPYDSLNLGGKVGDDAAAVAENRARLAFAVGVPTDRLVVMAQMHSADVALVREPPPEPLRVDAMVTDVAGIALVAMGADCAPVLVADPERGLLGVAHCGRPGLGNGVLDALVAALRELGAHSLVGRVGPAICGRCYEVPPDTHDEIAARVPAASARTRWGTPGLDIGGGSLAELRRLGVHAEPMGGCTYEDGHAYSHRRDGVTGRHAGVAWRTIKGREVR
jgi:YfiH family protein